jgi:hypothetical protein
MARRGLIRRVRSAAKRAVAPVTRKLSKALAPPLERVLERASHLKPVEAVREAKARVNVARRELMPRPVRLQIGREDLPRAEAMLKKTVTPAKRGEKRRPRAAALRIVKEEKREAFKVKRGQKHRHHK